MKRIIRFLVLLIIISGCDNSQKTTLDSNVIINSIIEYHESLIDNSAEVFPNTGDTILYQDFRVVQQTSQLTDLIREESKFLLSINGMTSKNTEFDKYFNMTDSSFVKEQISKNASKILDTAGLDNKFIAYFHEFESYFQADSIIDEQNKDLIFLDFPIFDSKGNSAIICYVYLKKSYQITKLVKLDKNIDDNNWKMVKQYGLVTKYIPENNDWEKDSVFHTIYVGSMER
jgi:hypothetical protein